MQQTQPIFQEDTLGQKSYNGFDDPKLVHMKEDDEKQATVQEIASPQKEAEPQPKDKEQQPTGFWKRFGDKAKGIFG